MRADLNVPLDKDLNITDDTRIRAAIPTLKYLMDNGSRVLLTSHLARSQLCHICTLLLAEPVWECSSTYGRRSPTFICVMQPHGLRALLINAQRLIGLRCLCTCWLGR